MARFSRPLEHLARIPPISIEFYLVCVRLALAFLIHDASSDPCTVVEAIASAGSIDAASVRAPVIACHVTTAVLCARTAHEVQLVHDVFHTHESIYYLAPVQGFEP